MNRQMQCLNDAERCFAEDHHPLVLDFLRRKRLPMGEFYDVVIFRYLRSVQLYLSSSRLQRYSFATVANRAMEWALKDHWRRYYKRPQNAVSLDKPDAEGRPPREPAAQVDVEEAVCSAISVGALCRLSDSQRQILYLRMEGYSDREIAKQTGMSWPLVQELFSHICEVAAA